MNYKMYIVFFFFFFKKRKKCDYFVADRVLFNVANEL